jgi:hypothetical protein
MNEEREGDIMNRERKGNIDGRMCTTKKTITASRKRKRRFA